MKQNDFEKMVKKFDPQNKKNTDQLRKPELKPKPNVDGQGFSDIFISTQEPQIDEEGNIVN